MDSSSIPLFRLTNQQLIAPEFGSPQAIISWMGALQAQDYPMAKWSVGVRLPGSTDKAIEAVVNKGDILRTHLLRPTWHFVTPADICWLLELTAPQIKASQRSRDRDLELTPEVYAKSNAIIEKALTSRGHMTREALMVELQAAGITTDQNRAAHLFMQAELDQIICSGTIQRGKPSYALLDERVPKPKKLAREEALAELARRYLTSRGPATLQDFSWWSGLPTRDAKNAIELVAPEFDHELVNGKMYWFSHDSSPPESKQPSVKLLPTYDEYILSYADRGAAIAPDLERHMKEISDRGVFWPIIVVNGQILATWKRTIKKDLLTIDIHPFINIEAPVLTLIKHAALDFANFCGKQLAFNT